jgi:hypothetical protein
MGIANTLAMIRVFQRFLANLPSFLFILILASLFDIEGAVAAVDLVLLFKNVLFTLDAWSI